MRGTLASLDRSHRRSTHVEAETTRYDCKPRQMSIVAIPHGDQTHAFDLFSASQTGVRPRELFFVVRVVAA